jgi:hypothetical protein
VSKRKKRRTAKQKAAFAKMLAGLKRHKAGKAMRRKRHAHGKRRNPVAREVYVREKRYQIAGLSSRDGGLVWFDGHGWVVPRARAASYGNTETAKYVAHNTKRKCAVVGEGESPQNVLAFLRGKK